MNIFWTYDSMKTQLSRQKLRNGRHTGNAIATHSFPRRILLTNKIPLQPAPSSQTILFPPSKLRIFQRGVIFNKTRRNTQPTTRAHNVFIAQHTHWHKHSSEHQSKGHTLLSKINGLKSTWSLLEHRLTPDVIWCLFVTVMIMDQIRGTCS